LSRQARGKVHRLSSSFHPKGEGAGDACAQLILGFFFLFFLAGDTVTTPAPVDKTVPGTRPPMRSFFLVFTWGGKLNDGLEASPSTVGRLPICNIGKRNQGIYATRGILECLIYVHRLRKYHGGEADFWRDRVMVLPRIL